MLITNGWEWHVGNQSKKTAKAFEMHRIQIEEVKKYIVMEISNTTTTVKTDSNNLIKTTPIEKQKVGVII